MTSTMDEIIEEAVKRYSKMPLMKLLAEENLISRLLFIGRYDNTVKRLHTILRSEIELKLR